MVTEQTIPNRCPSGQKELKIDGLSLVFYNFYLLPQDSSVNASNEGLEKLESPNKYQIMFEFSSQEQANHEVYLYKKTLTIAPTMLLTELKIAGNARLYFQLVEGKFLLATTVINVDRLSTILATKVDAERSLTVDDVFSMVMQLEWEQGSIFKELELQREKAVNECFGEFKKPPISSLNGKIVGIQIWDIADLKLSPTEMISGFELAHKYAWEITALLQVTSDLMRAHQTWRRRSHEQVAQLMCESTAVLADHRVITNGRVCLEISQVTHPTLTERSSDRLRLFGYDSTSIYLWATWLCPASSWTILVTNCQSFFKKQKRQRPTSNPPKLNSKKSTAR